MSVFETMAIAASGLTAQRVRMDVIAHNLAKVDSPGRVGNPSLHRLHVVLAPQGALDFSAFLARVRGHTPTVPGVRVVGLGRDLAPPEMVHQPHHPLADAEGMVAYPAVDPVAEMVDLITAARAYEASATAFAMAREAARRQMASRWDPASPSACSATAWRSTSSATGRPRV